MQRAIEFEVARHIKTHSSWRKLTQETRLWDDGFANAVMRSKEDAHDYRYFPEPDLAPLIVTEEFIERVRREMPELPEVRRNRFMEQYSLSFADASQLVSDRSLADYYEATAEASGNPRAAANWIRSELLRELEAGNLSAAESPVVAKELGVLIRLIDEEKISGKQGKEVLVEMFKTGKGAEAIVQEKGLVQVNDTGEIDGLIDEVIATNPDQLANYRSGKDALFGFFVGQVIKASKGKANPKIVSERLRAKLMA
jgi:aspartyl-tRNA(Asn)/glutamyl-tRNA(Gln) amidotransferase subunit B